MASQVEKDKVSCVIALLSWGAEVNVLDDNGNTPLHLASSSVVVQTLLVFGANTSLINKEVRLKINIIFQLTQIFRILDLITSLDMYVFIYFYFPQKYMDF